jgi:16S rRNA (guanine527-N7)-methyltransferase
MGRKRGVPWPYQEMARPGEISPKALWPKPPLIPSNHPRPMEAARISALLTPFLAQPLSPAQLDQISIYIDLLKRWNARINLTAIRHEEEIVTRHFGESLFLASHVFPNPLKESQLDCHPERSQVIREADDLAESKGPYAQSEPASPRSTLLTPPRVLDIGSGAGFPALPLKIWDPSITLTLIEANHKKAAFLREVARALTLTNVAVTAERTEAILARPNIPQAEVVTLRAVERFATILLQTLSFLAPHGRLALLVGPTQTQNLKNSPSISWSPGIKVPQSNARQLVIGTVKSGKEYPDYRGFGEPRET